MAQVNGIVVWAEGIKAELAKRLPQQRKTQRDKLAVLVATLLHVRSANLVELAAGLSKVGRMARLKGQVEQLMPDRGALVTAEVTEKFEKRRAEERARLTAE